MVLCWPCFHPLQSPSELRVSWLRVFGNSDLSIPVFNSIEILERVTSAENKPFSWTVYPNGGHGVTNTNPGQRPPTRLTDITAWLSAQSVGPNGGAP